MANRSTSSSSSSSGSSSSSSSSEIRGTTLPFSTEGVVWGKSKFLSSEVGAISSGLVQNRLSQTVGINSLFYKVGSVSLFLREKQGTAKRSFKVFVDIYEANSNGEPVTLLASKSKKSSEITWTGWHNFNFSLEERTAPISKFISVVFRQEGGNEDNYVSWLYASGSLPGASAMYSSDGGTTWIKHDNIIRLIKVIKASNPFSILCNSGVLKSSVAEQVLVNYENFDESTIDGGASYDGEHNGTSTQENHLAISNKNLIASVVVDCSGSMGWNDRGKNKVVAAEEIVDQLRSKYPGDVVFDFIKLGSSALGTPISGGGASYTTIKLDPYNPTSVRLNNDGTTPTISDGIVSSGFYNLNANHSYVLQSVVSGNSLVFSGSGLIDPNLGIRITENIQSVGSELSPIRLSVQAEGTGSENGGEGTYATVAEIPPSGSSQVVKSTVSGRILNTSGLTSALLTDTARARVSNPSIFETRETIDFIDTNGFSCAHIITNIGDSFIDFTPPVSNDFGDRESSLGGFIQQTSFYNTVLIDPNSMIELLVKDKEATTPISFYIQTPKGGRLSWDFIAMKEWSLNYRTYIDRPFDLVTYITDEDGQPLPSHTKIQYYIDDKPKWDSLIKSFHVEFEPAIMVEQGQDVITIPDIYGIDVDDFVVLFSLNGQKYDGYRIEEIDDINTSIRISPPILQDSFQLTGMDIIKPPKTSSSGQKLDMVFSAVDISSVQAGRLGQNRLPNDPAQIDPNERDLDKYNEDRAYWLIDSIEIPTVSSATSNQGHAAIHLLPITDDKLNTFDEDESKVSAIFNNTGLTEGERAELSALESMYAQLVEENPDLVTIIPEDTATVAEENIENTGEWILSPKYTSVGGITKFTSLSTDLKLKNLDGLSLRFDMNTKKDTGEVGILTKIHEVFPTVSIMDNSDNILTRYILDSYPVHFVSPIQIFCNPESGKTVEFDTPCDSQEGEKTTCKIVKPGVLAAGGESITLDYLVYHRGKYLNNAIIRIKIYDVFRTKIQTQFEPWETTPSLLSELSEKGIVFNDHLYHKLEKDQNGDYIQDIDRSSGYSEAVYLDGYEEGGFELNTIHGRASFTLAATDVVSRLLVKAEVICPDNKTISCTRTDSVWIKNPVSMKLILPSKSKSGYDIAPFEGKIVVTCFDQPVEDNMTVSLHGSVHDKYNQGDNDKIDPKSDIGAALARVSIIGAKIHLPESDNFLEQDSWPATNVKPSVGKTINGVASGFMIGPHGPVVMHQNKNNKEDNSLVGDEEMFNAYGSYKPDNARGSFDATESLTIEWVSNDIDTDALYIYMAFWKYGSCLGISATCYADGWDDVIALADAPASKNRFFEFFDEQWLTDDLLGLSRPNKVSRAFLFLSDRATKSCLPGRRSAFYPTRPTDPYTGYPFGEVDELLEFGSESRGWAGAVISNCVQVPEPTMDNDSDACIWPPCTEVDATGFISLPNSKIIMLKGCASDDYSGCKNTTANGESSNNKLKITWIEPLEIALWVNGKKVSPPFDVIRDGLTQSEIWTEVKFSGRPLPLVAREHNVKDAYGFPVTMPSTTMDIYCLEQTWDDKGKEDTRKIMRDGTVSLTDYNPIVSICRTSVSNGHYHSCIVDDITGNGITTGTFLSDSITPIDDHLHTVSNFVFNNVPDVNSNIHNHTPLSVSITKINPISNTSLNICIDANVLYDASKTPITRKVHKTICTDLQWFDFWEISLTCNGNKFAQSDVLSTNAGLDIDAVLRHRVNGLYVAVDDGIRISFVIDAFKVQKSEEGKSFDLSTESTTYYAAFEVSATAFVDGKLITGKIKDFYKSNLQWSSSVNALVDEPTNDGVYVSNALSNIDKVKGGSMLYDAIVLASDRINIYKSDNRNWLTSDQAIFVLTDGCENLSQRNINQVVSRIKMLTNGERRAFVAIVLFGRPSRSNVILAYKIKNDTNGVIVSVPIGYDPLLVPDLISSILSSGSDFFNSGSYIGTVNIAGSDTNEASGLCTQICVNLDIPSGSTATISVRFSLNKDTWTQWSEARSLVPPNTCISFNSKFKYMQYIVKLYGNSNFESPEVKNLEMSYLKPSTDIVFLQPITVNMEADEYISETVISHVASIPVNSTVKYGSVNSNTINEIDYGTAEKPWFNANERSIMLTRTNEPTYAISTKTYKAINSGWPTGSYVDVYIINKGETDGNLADNKSYILNSSNGTVSFFSQIEDDSRIILDIKPENMIRMAIKMENYTTTPISIGQMTVMFNKTKRVNRYLDGIISRHPICDDLEESSSSSESSIG